MTMLVQTNDMLLAFPTSKAPPFMKIPWYYGLGAKIKANKIVFMYA